MPHGQQPAATPVWFKSSYSGGNTTECVETAFVPSGVVVRDSKRPSGPCLPVSAGAWQKFLVLAGKG